MKRDMDLVREILLGIEANPASEVAPTPEIGLNFGIEDHTPKEIAYHVSMLIDAGYIKGKQTAIPGLPFVQGLTMKGHDYLDSIRDPIIWDKTKEGAKKAGGFTIELLGDLAKGFIKKKVKEHTGIDL